MAAELQALQVWPTVGAANASVALVASSTCNLGSGSLLIQFDEH
jgi:hypothetical protein